MKYLFLPLLFIFILFPQESQAQALGLLTCTEAQECNFCELGKTIYNVEVWVVMIATFIAVIMAAYAGMKLVYSKGDVGAVTSAKEMLGNVAIGMFIMLAAWMIVDTVVKTTVGGDLGIWNKFEGDCGSSYSVGKTKKGTKLTNPPVEVRTVFTEDGPDSINNGVGGGEIDSYVNSTAGAVTFSFTTALSIQQKGHLSSTLASFQSCIANKVIPGDYLITSVSDNVIANGSKTWEQCASGGKSAGCAHSVGSCHYGGSSCVGQSYALDIRTSNLDQAKKTSILSAATACGGWGKDEGNHLHISKGTACGCN